MPAVRIEDLTIEYVQGGYSVRPDGLSAGASDGELVLLLGPSGCGKTTLLSCLAGLLTPSAATGVREVRLAAGELAFEMGDRSDFVYVVEHGEIELYRPLADGGEELIGRRRPEEVFGEIGPLLGMPRSTAARATKESVLTAQGPQEFRHRWAGAGKGAV